MSIKYKKKDLNYIIKLRDGPIIDSCIWNFKRKFLAFIGTNKKFELFDL